MTVFGNAFSLWIAYLVSIGFAADSHLNPGTTVQTIEQVEAVIGFDFPDDLKALYRLANGQIEPYMNQLEAGTFPPLHAETAALFQASLELATTIEDENERSSALFFLEYVAKSAGWQSLAGDVSFLLESSR